MKIIPLFVLLFTSGFVTAQDFDMVLYQKSIDSVNRPYRGELDAKDSLLLLKVTLYKQAMHKLQKDFDIPKIGLSILGDGYTLAHEIGHVKFSLRHPDNDLSHLKPSPIEMDPTPGNGPYMLNDKNNFMYHKGTVRNNKVRHYQWKKILSGKYGN